ncbi:hypothetical protein [Streptomyces sp. NPDC006552]|uniref:hypothetical protein n=1 Tax=Streptomyces sp. NPDC006552 TaxID=3157179 RepID=UPI0033A3A9E8
MTPRILRAPWRPGPALDHATAPCWISVTEFTADGHLRAAAVAVNGTRLRRRWPRTAGSVGMWLWADPPRRRSGSVSVWTDEEPLTGFVRRPDHARIVRAFRGHGTMRATGWAVPDFDAGSVWATAHDLLTAATPWPAAAARAGKAPR